MNYKTSLLPAVMLSVAAINTLTVAASANAASATNGEQAVPAVLSVRPPSEYPVPERLTQYTHTIADATNLSMRNEHCATISGSDSGWDDSDCF
ncbi:hypothetical protein [Calothrix sp. NIES-2098]|uniref:hypothetical protein n=1 Tax=Calothrix sp. NIES-2098 TaxID=1954171 RepID=UPI000B61F3AA|nr:hypothetical protein NIES2098_24750 [Calothrix sp. NIES-2098]